MYPFPTHSVMFQSEKKKMVKQNTERKEADATAEKAEKKSDEKVLPDENKKDKKREKDYDPNVFKDHRGMWF